METTSETPSLVTSQERLTGRVKWFNNQAGYGFITVTDGSRSGSDIFVHHSGVQVISEQYKYLVQGEYVQFVLNATPGGQHEFQASNVSGINGGKLMCETRRDFKEARTSYRGGPEDEEQVEEEPRVRAPRSARPPALERSQSSNIPLRKPRGPPRSASGQDAGEKKEWTLVDKKATAKPVRKPRAPKDSA